MAKLGPITILNHPTEIMTSTTMLYIQSMGMEQRGMISLIYKTMRVEEIVKLTEFVTNSKNIENFNLTLNETSDEQDFALNVYMLVEAVLNSKSISTCSIRIKTPEFELSCNNKETLQRDFSLLQKVQGECENTIESLLNSVLSLSGQVQSGMLNMYQRMSELTLVDTVGVLPCVGVPCLGADENQAQDSGKKKKLQ